VHGLNGHPFNTFAYRPPQDHKKVVMWARDLLPQSLDRAEYHGRYISYGYPARVFDRDRIPNTLRTEAENLLEQISLDRQGVGILSKEDSSNIVQDSERPLFFACHSLGGLIVCQVRQYTPSKNFYS
jgi:hypothetical protein